MPAGTMPQSVAKGDSSYAAPMIGSFVLLILVLIVFVDAQGVHSQMHMSEVCS